MSLLYNREIPKKKYYSAELNAFKKKKINISIYIQNKYVYLYT